MPVLGGCGNDIFLEQAATGDNKVLRLDGGHRPQQALTFAT